MAEERFPIQHGPSVPWEFMAPHDAQCRKNHSGQSLQHIAGRGGLGSTEAWCCVNGLALWPTHDTKEGVAAARQRWFELAERVNREWSIKQARAEVLAACAQRGFDAAIEEGPPASVEDTAAYIRDEILKLQPAAKHLEELLWKSRFEAVTSSPECWHYNTETDQEFMERYFSWRKKSMAELEKARAISEKP